jgi:predicted transcriptional regulator
MITRTTTYQNRMENRLPRIRDKLKDLVEMGLVEEYSSTKALKNNDIILLQVYSGWLPSFICN